MEYKVVLSSDLALSAQDLTSAWNDDAACRAAAHAEAAPAPKEAFDPLLDAAGFILGNLALGVTANMIYDLLKSLLRKRGVSRETEIRQLKQPDGTEVIVITVKET